MTGPRELIPGYLLVLLAAVTLFSLTSAGGGGHRSHVIIHVPYKVKTIHHTHTITKHVHHGHGGGGGGGGGEDSYEVLGYTVGHPIDLGGHGGGGGFGGGGGHDFGGGGGFEGGFSGGDWSGH